MSAASGHAATLWGMKTETKVKRLRARSESLLRELDRIGMRMEKVRTEREKIEVELRGIDVGRRTVRKPCDLNPAVQAGHKNVAKLRTVFASRRRLTQAEAGREAGLSSGTMTWAVRALVSDGVIRETGRMVGTSREYEYVPKGRRTKLAPGE